MSVPCGKLVGEKDSRDHRSEGRHLVTRILDQASYPQALLAKLTEVAHEAGNAAADLPGELAGVLEVLRALTATAKVS